MTHPPSRARWPHLLRPVLLLALLAPLAAPLSGNATQAALVTRVRLDPTRSLTINGSFAGLGAQDDSNLLWSAPNRAAGAHTPADFTQIVAPRLRTLRLPLVRKFIDLGWYAAEPGRYSWDSPEMQGLYANLATHQANGARVLLTIWSIPRWLSAQTEIDRDSALGPAASFPTPGENPDYEARWARVVADLLRHLYGLDGSGLRFDSIAFVGGPNELARVTPARLVRPYRLLRAELAAAGLGEQVALFGPDAFVEELPMALAEPGLNELLGLYDFHYYGQGPIEPGLIQAIDRLTAAVAPTGKQLWLTEFGEVTAKNDDWRTLALVAIAAMNHGLGAALMWNTQDQIYNTGNIPAWGLWEVYDTGYRLKPAYYAWQILASHLPPAATIYGHSCDREQCPGLRLATLSGASGHRTIIAYNLSDRPHQISVELGTTAPKTAFVRYLLDPARPPDPHRDGLWLDPDRALTVSTGSLDDTLPPGALAVYVARPLPPRLTPH